MKFELTILGCGGAIPTLERKPTAQYLNIQDRHFLIDCGEGTQIQLRKYNCKFSKIDHIFISHLHGDHFLGLFGYLSTLSLLTLSITIVFIVIEWIGRNNAFAIQNLENVNNRFFRYGYYLIIVFTILILGNFNQNEFIYFQF